MVDGGGLRPGRNSRWNDKSASTRSAGLQILLAALFDAPATRTKGRRFASPDESRFVVTETHHRLQCGRASPPCRGSFATRPPKWRCTAPDAMNGGVDEEEGRASPALPVLLPLLQNTACGRSRRRGEALGLDDDRPTCFSRDARRLGSDSRITKSSKIVNDGVQSNSARADAHAPPRDAFADASSGAAELDGGTHRRSWSARYSRTRRRTGECWRTSWAGMVFAVQPGHRCVGPASRVNSMFEDSAFNKDIAPIGTTRRAEMGGMFPGL